jgi:uncharacterized protein
MRKTEIITLRDEQRLNGVLSFDDAAPAVIFAHGLGSTRQGEKAAAMETECGRRGWAFVAFDFHGHGASDGTMLDLRGSRLLADLDAITQFVHARGHETIFLVGSSMGGWAAAWFAARHPERVRACALIAPAFRFLEWRHLNTAARQQWQLQGRIRIVNEWIDLELDYALYAEANDYSFAQLCEQFTTPCLIVHGMRDDTIPYVVSIEFTEQCNAQEAQLLLVKNGDHRLNTHKDWLAQTMCDFFQQTR